MEKVVKLELIEMSACETGSAKGGTQKGKVGSRGQPLQDKDKNVVKVKTEPRASTVGLLDATLSVNVRGKHKDWPIDMGMFSACRKRRVWSCEHVPSDTWTQTACSLGRRNTVRIAIS